MLKHDLQVLIVEDDPNLGKALKELVSRLGYKAVMFPRPDDALSHVKLQPVHAAIIDCMLPKMNGRELATKLREEVSSDLPVILTSGIFKDKNFSREAMQTTGASAFLTKPFDLDELVGILERKLAHLVEVPMVPIYDLFGKPHPSPKERIRAINDSEQVHGYDLPWLFSLLLDPSISGHLNIISGDGEVAGVGFHHGHIVQVNVRDTQSYFGVLLVEKGFISPSEIEEILSRGRSRRMGDVLVEANVLSPHAISIVIAEQQSIRLAKTIGNTSCKVNFVPTEDVTQDAHTDRTVFVELVDDWVSSKIPVEWLKSFYLPWMSRVVNKGPEFSETHRVLTLNCLNRVPGLLRKAISGLTLDQLASQYDGREEQFLRALHVLLLSRLITFGEQKKSMNFDAHRTRLERLELELEKQNYFDRLGVSQKAKEQEIKRAYHELAKVLHPDKLSQDTPADVRDLTRSVFSKISAAYETLSDPKKRETYVLELEQGRAEMVLQAESLSEQAKTYLAKGDFKRARSLLEQAHTLAPPSAEQKLLLMWAKIKTQVKSGDSAFSNEIKDQMSQLPPEDRHTAMYHFIKGLLLRYNNDADMARKCFEHALAVDAQFLDARRELNLIKLAKKNEKPTDLMRADLKDVVGMLFKKKK